MDRAAVPANGCDVETLPFDLIVPLRWLKIASPPPFSHPSQKGNVKPPGRFLASAEILKGSIGHSALMGFLEMFPSGLQLPFSVRRMPDWCGWGWAEWSQLLRWDVYVVGVSHGGRVWPCRPTPLSSLSSWLQYFDKCSMQFCHFLYLPLLLSILAVLAGSISGSAFLRSWCLFKALDLYSEKWVTEENKCCILKYQG